MCKTSENLTCEFVIARRTRVLIARLTLTHAIVGKHVRAAHPLLLLEDGGDGEKEEEEEEGGAASVVAGVDCCSEVVRYVRMFLLLLPSSLRSSLLPLRFPHFPSHIAYIQSYLPADRYQCLHNIAAPMRQASRTLIANHQRYKRGKRKVT